MMRSHDEPALITDAERGRDEQLRIRQVRYIIMMSLRALLLIVATVLVMAEAPLLWLWVPLCALGMIVLPWVAVLVANDRLPKERHRIFRKHAPRRSKPRSVGDKKSEVVDVDSRPDDTA